MSPAVTDSRCPWGARTAVMAILNLTPDSFSDGGQHRGLQRACQAAHRMAAQGADLIDLGAQSTRPGALDVGAEEELRRLLPVLQMLVAARREGDLPSELLISIDTFLAPVAAASLDAGADWINDVSGGMGDAAMLPLIADRNCPYVLMHRRGDARTMNDLASYKSVTDEVEQELLKRTDAALKAGVSTDQILWDPGLGFAKASTHNLTLLQRLPQLTAHGFPLLVGPSRKRFIGEVLSEPRPKARIWGTAASVCSAIAGGARVIRVHDVGPMAQTCRMADALWPRSKELSPTA